MAKIIDGKAIAEEIKQSVKKQTAELLDRGHPVGLAVILVGEDPASQIYVRNKEKDCREVGIESYKYLLDQDTSEEDLLFLIRRLNEDEYTSGILCQLPLPKGLDERRILEAIDPKKDVDAFHPENVGRILLGEPRFAPCTPAGIMEMLCHENIEVAGKHCVVVGRSNIVGKPMAMLMLHQDATVTICHSKTQNLAEICRRADILVSAVGKAGFITADMVKPDAVVIDVGMNRDANGKLCGDVDFAAVEPIASHITPVPGGVGPMTRAVLLLNTLKAAENFAKAREEHE